jgi:hypothetical protein
MAALAFSMAPEAGAVASEAVVKPAARTAMDSMLDERRMVVE